MTQLQILKKHFAKRGAKLTQLEALIKYGVGRLASRIQDLESDGYQFAHNMIAVQSRNGRARVAEYVLVKAPRCTA